MGALLFFSACKKDADPTYEPPVTEPLTFTSAKTGETIVIKGQNFSTTASENVVTFNGVEAIVVSATETELVVIVPANATSGKVVVTVHGHTTEIGTLTLAPFTLYTIKDHNSYVGNDYYREYVAINPADGKETVLATRNDYTDFNVYEAKYVSSTNELVGVNIIDRVLAKFNVVTKQFSSVKFSVDAEYTYLVTDLNGNLYGTQKNFNTQNVNLVKIDPATGTVTIIKDMGTEGWWSLAYISATNEIVGLWKDEQHMKKINLTTKETTTLQISNNVNLEYKNLIGAGSELYGVQYEFLGNNTALALVKINPATGATETVVSDYNKSTLEQVYDPVRKEILSLWNGSQHIFRYNMTTKATSTFTLTTLADFYYSELTSN